MPLHVDRARIKAGEPPAFQAQVGDARELPFDDGAFDAVLLLGPLYHLLELQDRLRALREARRVSKRGGSLFAAAISRYALPGDGIRNGWIDGEEKERSVEHVIAHGLTAALDQGWFLTMCYCHRADELRAEVGSAELAVEAVYGIEGPAFLVADIDEKWADPATRERLLLGSEARRTRTGPAGDQRAPPRGRAGIEPLRAVVSSGVIRGHWPIEGYAR